MIASVHLKFANILENFLALLLFFMEKLKLFTNTTWKLAPNGLNQKCEENTFFRVKNGIIG